MKFGSVGSVLGRVYIRQFESNSELSRLACECVILLFAIAESTVDNVNTTVEDIQKSISKVDHLSNEFFRVVSIVFFKSSTCKYEVTEKSAVVECSCYWFIMMN